jgi:hypothetical protein
MLIQFFGGPVDGEIRDVPDDTQQWLIATYEPGDIFTTHEPNESPTYGVIKYQNSHSLVFSETNPVTVAFRMERQ